MNLAVVISGGNYTAL